MAEITRLQAGNPTEQTQALSLIHLLSKSKRSGLHYGAIGLTYGLTRGIMTGTKAAATFGFSKLVEHSLQNDTPPPIPVAITVLARKTMMLSVLWRLKNHLGTSAKN